MNDARKNCSVQPVLWTWPTLGRRQQEWGLGVTLQAPIAWGKYSDKNGAEAGIWTRTGLHPL